MSTRLTIGVVSLGSGTRAVLDGLGVAYEAISRWDVLHPSHYAVVLSNASLDKERRAILAGYVQAGGAVLDTGHLFGELSPGRFERVHAGSLLPEDGDDVFGDLWLLDLHQTVRRRFGAERLAGFVDLGAFGAGAVAHLPFDIERAVAGVHAVRKRFAVGAGMYADEITSRVAKGELALLVERALRWLHARRALPYLHRWPFPSRAPGVFAYRVDSDYGTRLQIEDLHERAARNNIPLTWFLHVAAHERWLERFAAFERDEIGLHCYRHRTFDAEPENTANIAEARALMERAGLSPRGFAAPNGFYNRGLADALAHAGFDYSSEFSYDYDNFPSFPSIGGVPRKVLQVPVHPVCIGSLIRAKADDEMMARYFRTIIDRSLRIRRPAMLYHHPGHERWDVMEDGFRYALERGLLPLTMGSYADWWRRRLGTRFQATLEEDTIVLHVLNAADDVEIACRAEDGSAGFIAPGLTPQRDVRCDIPPAPPVPAPDGTASARRFSLRTMAHTLEDYNARARQ